jgi:hypothetical protein
LWNETSAGQESAPFYAISLDGVEVSRVRQTSYDLNLKAGRFDPTIVTPPIAGSLLADSGNELYIVQFVTQPLDALRGGLVDAGATIYSFIPNHSYIVRMSDAAKTQVEALPYVRAVTPYHPAYRLESYLRDNLDRADELFPLQRYNIMVFEEGLAQKSLVADGLRATGGSVDEVLPGGLLLHATLTPEQLVALVHYNEVQFVARDHPAESCMDYGRAIGGGNYVEQVGGYTGGGVVGELLDQGDPETTHQALTGRCVGGTSEGDPCDGGADCPDGDCQRAPIAHHRNVDSLVSTHAIATFGIIYGDGTDAPEDLDEDHRGLPRAKGMMPEGQGIFADYCRLPEAQGFVGCTGRELTTRDCHTCELVCSDSTSCDDECKPLCGDNLDPGVPFQAVFQSNSWGNATNTGYEVLASELDRILLFYDILVCQAQGNSGGYDYSLEQAWAKNVVSVGGVHHLNRTDKSLHAWTNPDCEWCSKGSNGPAPDGRIKPDLTHFYDAVLTTYRYDDYDPEFSGTSAATAITCGHFGLFFEMWTDDRDSHDKGIFGNPLLDPDCDPEGEDNCVFKNRPHAATAKAMMINAARPYDFNVPPTHPNHDLTRGTQGWGLPSVGKLYALRDNFVVIVDETHVIMDFQSYGYAMVVPAQAAALKATLVWTDPPGALSPAPALVNDLDLFATFNPDPVNNTYHGNYGLVDSNWSPPGGECNRVDNVENIFIKDPLGGDWTIQVSPESITTDAHLETPELDADYALVVSLDFDCNGNDFLDSEEIADNPSLDSNDNGILDECEAEAPIPPSSPPQSGFAKNRYISFVPQNPGMQTALRVTLTDLPPAFADHEGCTLWVGPPSDVSEVAGTSGPGGPNDPKFKRAELQTTQHCMDWSTVGVLHVADSEIVPSAVYTVQAINCATNPLNELSYSPPLSITTSKWGDIAGGGCQAPNNAVDMVDISCLIDKFNNRPGAPMKARSDIAPDVPDKVVNFVDIEKIVDAFRSVLYPYFGPDECP